MNERLTTRDLADVLAVQTGMDKKRADEFINTLSLYISQGIEKNKSVRVLGLGTFKVVLVRERESVHIQTGERFIIPAHHKLSFVPDKDFKEHINRPFAFLEPIEAVEEQHKPKKVSFNIGNTVDDDKAGKQAEERVDNVAVDIGDNQDLDYTTKDSSEAPIVAVVDDQAGTDYFSSAEYTSVSIEDVEEKDAAEEINDFDSTEEEDLGEYEEPVSIDDNDNTDEIDEADIAAISDNTPKTDDSGSKSEYAEPVISSKTPEMKKKVVPSWFLIVIPIIVLFGSILGGYLSVYYNTDKTSVNDQPLNVLTYEPDANGDTPLQEGGAGISDTGKTDNMTISDGFAFPDNAGENTGSEKVDSANTTEAAVSGKKDDRATIDWLAPSPEASNAQQKRANKPNEEIERKNRELAKTTTGTGTTSAGNTNANNAGTNATQTETKEKIIPKTVPLTAGSSLRQIAEEYYGDRVFWVYIYEYNKDKIKNYNNIPVGTEIRLPLPRTYGINSKSQSSKQKAEQKQSELYRSNSGN